MAFAIHINMYVDTIYQHKLAVDMLVPSFLTPLPPPSPPHPSRLSQSTRFELPVSYIKLPLAIYFMLDNVYGKQSLTAGPPGKSQKRTFQLKHRADVFYTMRKKLKLNHCPIHREQSFTNLD